MKSPLTLALGIYLICFKPELALSDLITRQTCDELYCTDWNFVLDSIGGAAGAAAGAASQWLDFFQPPSPETAPAPDTDPTEPRDSQVRPLPNNPPEPQADTELWIQAPPPELSGCQAAAPSNSDAKYDPVSHSLMPLWIYCPQVRSFLMPSGAR